MWLVIHVHSAQRGDYKKGFDGDADGVEMLRFGGPQDNKPQNAF